MYPTIDIDLEEIFQRFVANNNYVDYYYLELCIFLVKKGRIADFEKVFKIHSEYCLMPDGLETDDITDILAYSIIHDLTDVFYFIDSIVWLQTNYTPLIIHYKRIDMLRFIIDANNYDDLGFQPLYDIHNAFIHSIEPWYDGEDIAFSFSRNTDIHDSFLHAF